ncbi:O-antigen ligase family protein [Nocardioides sp. LMS-CY]|uniref:O-antigen ligase n=1 Tax=Nocardioides soli TaxID=1036020 RepID=A0A7W4VV71_9ACTN|nr:O-antigen ligase family protein [Nocardioides sp. LMS-CY]MBB3041937.1 O-antigen ligase [Nocardioides soli]QWF21438.1 O-antigen ligase family protein [Nocardioides sp. LMS-CY]
MTSTVTVGDAGRVRIGLLPGRGDAVTVLTIYAVALIAIPSRLVIGPLGGAGSPATVVGLGCALWWLFAQLARPTPNTAGRQPVRACLIGFVLTVLAAFVAACVRPIDPIEFSSATLALVLLGGWAGVLLVANDGIPDLDRLLVLVRRLVALGAAMAALGITQFLTHQPLVDRISIPGLVANHAGFGLTMREGFTRPAGTATHPIEYGAVVTMLLPLALALAMGDHGRSAVRRWTPVALIAICVPLSISRSALLACAVGTIVVLVSWPPRARRAAFGVSIVGSVAVYLLIPGMLGSLLGLFTGIGGDSSAQSRTGSYAIAADFVSRAPLFGRGFQTFLPSYRILDNQYLGLLIEVGVVGLTAFLLLVVTGLRAARVTRVRGGSPTLSQLGQGLLGAVAAGAVTLALFDALSFPMSAGTFFLLLGIAGAARRLVLAEERPRP